MKQKFSDQVIARLRTVVPLWWGALVTWLLAQFPFVKDTLVDLNVDLNDPQVVATITGLAVLVFTIAWDYLWKRVEHILPPWLTRIVVGSNRTPSYAPTSADGSAQVITQLGGDQPVLGGGDGTVIEANGDEPDDFEDDGDAPEPVEAVN